MRRNGGFPDDGLWKKYQLSLTWWFQPGLLLANYEALQMDLADVEEEHDYLEKVSELLENALMENYHEDYVDDEARNETNRVTMIRRLNFAVYSDNSMIEVGDTVSYDHNGIKIEDALVRKIDDYVEKKNDYVVRIKNMKGEKKVYKSIR